MKAHRGWVGVLVILFAFSNRAAAEAQQKDQPRRLTAKQARKAAEEAARQDYTAEQIREAGKQLALQRAQTWSWLVNPAAQVNWFGGRAYLGHLWETRPRRGALDLRGPRRPLGGVGHGPACAGAARGAALGAATPGR